MWWKPVTPLYLFWFFFPVFGHVIFFWLFIFEGGPQICCDNLKRALRYKRLRPLPYTTMIPKAMKREGWAYALESVYSPRDSDLLQNVMVPCFTLPPSFMKTWPVVFP